MKIGLAGSFDLNIIKQVFSESDKLAIEGTQSLGGSQSSQYALRLVKVGHDVFLYTTSVSVPKGEERVYCSGQVKLRIGHRPGPLARMLTFQYGEIQTIKAMINKDQLDIIHAQWSYEFAAAAIKSNFPHIITVRDWAPKILLYTRHPYRLMRLLLCFMVFANGKHFVANSPYLHRKLKFLGARLLNFVPNGVPDDLLINKRKSFSTEKLEIIAISNGANRLKNTHRLLEAISLLVKENLNISLKMIGSGHEPGSELWCWAKNNDLLGNVEFLGSLNFESVLDQLDHSDLMVHPSLEESFGNILVEAMCRGVPVMGGRESGAVPWVVRDAGLLIDVSSAKSIAEGIKQFYDDRSLLDKYARAGVENVSSRFTLSAIEKSYTGYYHKIISGSLS